MLRRICDRCGRIMKNDLDTPDFNSVVSAFIDRNDEIVKVYKIYNLCNECKNDFESFYQKI